jgi:hypothetical protein
LSGHKTSHDSRCEKLPMLFATRLRPPGQYSLAKLKTVGYEVRNFCCHFENAYEYYTLNYS